MAVGGDVALFCAGYAAPGLCQGGLDYPDAAGDGICRRKAGGRPDAGRVPTLEDGSFDFVLYEDDGETDAYKNGVYTTTPYTCNVKVDGDGTSIFFQIGERTGATQILPRAVT